MKKLLSFLLAAALVSVLAVPAAAAGSGITMTDTAVQESGAVYVAVSLQSETAAEAIGLSYSYDDTLLKIIPAECRWLATGVLSDFSRSGSQAVWAADSVKNLSGDLCVLAFRVLDMQSFQEATVSCTVVLEDGTASAKNYQASARITKVCEHTPGKWTSNGELNHIRICEKCGDEELQSHTWDNGTQSQDPQKPNMTIITYRCDVCGGQKVSEVPGGGQNPPPSDDPKPPEQNDPKPTRPQPSYPEEDEEEVVPTTRPSKPDPDDNKPSSGGTSGNSGSTTSGQPQKNNKNQQTANRQPSVSKEPAQKTDTKNDGNKVPAAETRPMAVKVDETEATADTVPSDTREESKEKSAAGWIAAGTALAVGAVGAFWLFAVKKKKV